MNISVELLHVTPLEIIVGAIRQCYESGDKSDSIHMKGEYILGARDKALVNRIIESGHTSTLEHCSFNFLIKGISRLNLQELARHRMASLSVKSSRYTLKELKGEESFLSQGKDPQGDANRISKYINVIGIPQIDMMSIQALENLRLMVQAGYCNDQCKYNLPECYKTDLYWSINVRSLRNFLSLRLSDRAHFEIQELAEKVYQQVPDSHKFLFKDII